MLQHSRKFPERGAPAQLFLSHQQPFLSHLCASGVSVNRLTLAVGGLGLYDVAARANAAYRDLARPEIFMSFLAESLQRIKPSATIAVTDKARALKAAG